MSRVPMKPSEIDAKIDAAELEYVTALGKVAHSWNHLHEALGSLFARILDLPIKKILPVWYSTNNDRAQREMLKGALATNATLTDAQKKDITWLLNAVDRLAIQRNAAIHAPCSFAIDETKGAVFAAPHHFHGNPRALELMGKEIIKEFRWYQARSDALKKYANAIGASLNPHVRRPWPDKPKLPDLGQK